VTGAHLPGTPTTIEERQAVIERLYDAAPIIAKALKQYGERFSLLFAGEWAKATRTDGSPFPSPSEADLAFCNMLVGAGACTEGACMAVIQLSGLYDDKWQQEGYQKRTLGKAQEGKGSTVQGAGRRVQVQSARELARKELSPIRWVVLGEQATPKPGPQPAALTEAQAFLCARLADGPRPSTEVQEEAKAAGISETTLRRAQKDLHIKVEERREGLVVVSSCCPQWGGLGLAP